MAKTNTETLWEFSWGGESTRMDLALAGMVWCWSIGILVMFLCLGASMVIESFYPKPIKQPVTEAK